MTRNPLPDGLYEALVSSELERTLSLIGEAATVEDIDAAHQPHILARHVQQATHRALSATSDPGRRVAMVNDLLAVLHAHDAEVSAPTRQLRRIHRSGPLDTPGLPDVRPSTPLSEPALLTNTRGEPNLGSELRAEIESSNEVDLLCAFVKWHGLRLLETELSRLRDRGAPFRVLTTTYMGATERRALDRLVNDFGAEVRIQYDAARTRLHAKAWMFRRETGFDTAYVGSSNLSRAALLDGVEWNVRLSTTGTGPLIDKFRATFDTYWNDASFEVYDPARDADRLDDALNEASGRAEHSRVTINLSGLEVRPFAYQQQMLDAVHAEREVHDRHRNLVVAATGTGKTVIAALDYRRLCHGTDRPSLLFVAHRREILDQALRTYREVLTDATFGELYVGGIRPERGRHVFASIQSLSSHGVAAIPSDAFDVVVIDEFHHAEAASYRRLIEHLTPRELLGLTATPERADGVDVRAFFDGRIAAELRLWDALGADLLCPFHYFAVADGTDLRRVGWKHGRYDDSELGNVYTGNTARAALVLRQLRDKVSDPAVMRALGFCVSVAHAEFMTTAFNEAGVRAATVSGATPQTERERTLQDLRDGRLQTVFTVDVFNEGIDIPDVDTVLFLRPTESATIFLQQLGRGLRRTKDKAVLTVLDFVGYHRQEFRFDLKLRALTGQTRKGLEREVERGFPLLPSGCQIVMDRQAQQIVLDNIRGQVANRWRDIVAELRRHPEHDLATFLDESGLELSDVLKAGSKSWTTLQRDANLISGQPEPGESELLKRMRALAHVDDPLRAATYQRLLGGDVGAVGALSPGEQRLARMLFFSLYPSGAPGSYDEGLRQARALTHVVGEASAIVDLSFDAARHQTVELEGELSQVPLRIHGRYQREEILAGLDYASLSRKPTSVMQGVAYSPDLNVDMLFVTLKKSESDFSPTTMYRDYPIDAKTFHWESQSTTSVSSPTGQRYLNGSSTVLLFVRHDQKDEFGTSPYLFLGPVSYAGHTGDRPIAITWSLQHPMPAEFLASARLIAN
ncbi:helicase [Nocardioides sp. OK12]|uniref:DUF3427 domain-containing protein n=1 Tax=Nocardioides sp. OK12 TaxID=2758661 RepID=UPI0021C27220|nr:DUF3427 domain-containing protein [Nocardioides sp. OK12]GHJ58839.1 helicase [Nocardioides sp. OK12]